MVRQSFLSFLKQELHIAGASHRKTLTRMRRTQTWTAHRIWTKDRGPQMRSAVLVGPHWSECGPRSLLVPIGPNAVRGPYWPLLALIGPYWSKCGPRSLLVPNGDSPVVQVRSAVQVWVLRMRVKRCEAPALKNLKKLKKLRKSMPGDYFGGFGAGDERLCLRVSSRAEFHTASEHFKAA